MTDWRAELEAITAQVPEAELPDLIGELARADAIARARLNPPCENGRPQASDPAMYLTAEEVAKRLHVSAKWVYAHQSELGVVRLGAAIRFPERALERYLTAH